MYPIFNKLTYIFYPTTNILHPIFLFTYFLLFLLVSPSDSHSTKAYKFEFMNATDAKNLKTSFSSFCIQFK